MTIRMNKIFPYLACYFQKLIFLFGNRDRSPVKESSENKIGTIILENDIYIPFHPVLACDHSQIIILYTSYITQVCFAFYVYTE